MQEFYLLQSQVSQRGGLDQNSRRVAPISVSFHCSVFSYQNNLVNQDLERDISIKGLEVYLSRIEEYQRGGRDSIINES